MIHPLSSFKAAKPQPSFVASFVASFVDSFLKLVPFSTKLRTKLATKALLVPSLPFHMFYAKRTELTGSDSNAGVAHNPRGQRSEVRGQ